MHRDPPIAASSKGTALARAVSLGVVRICAAGEGQREREREREAGRVDEALHDAYRDRARERGRERDAGGVLPVDHAKGGQGMQRGDTMRNISCNGACDHPDDAERTSSAPN